MSRCCGEYFFDTTCATVNVPVQPVSPPNHVFHYDLLILSSSDKSNYGQLPFELPTGWMWCRLGDVCFDLQYGTSRKSDNRGKVAVLRMGNLQNGEVDYNDLVFTSDTSDIEKYSLIPFELLFNRTNSPEWVGKTAIYRGDVPAIFADTLFA